MGIRRVNPTYSPTLNRSRGNETIQKEKRISRMDYRHNKGIRANINRNSTSLLTLLRSYSPARKLQPILESIRNAIKKTAIPATAVSSSFLFANFAYAESFIERGSVKNGKFSNQSYDEQSMWERIGSAADKFNATMDWFKEFPQHVYDFSIDVFAFIFKMLMLVGLQTPSFIFNGSYTHGTTIVFSIISISIIILLTIFESTMQMISKVAKTKYTDFSTIMRRLPVAIGVAGFTPFLFEKGFQFINKLTRGIISAGGNLFQNNNIDNLISLSGVDLLGMILFDVVALGLIIPILLQGGRRWWDLFILSSVSPLALTAWMFDRHRHLHTQWWNEIKRLSVVQLVFATFITLMGVFLYGARFMSADQWVYKILIMLGALYRLANPPSFVKSYARGEQDINGLFDSYKKTAKGIYGTVTLKNFTPLNYYRSQKALNASRKALRMQKGVRYVDHLLKGGK